MSKNVQSFLDALESYFETKRAGGDTEAAAAAVRREFNPAVFDAIDSYNNPRR